MVFPLHWEKGQECVLQSTQWWKFLLLERKGKRKKEKEIKGIQTSKEEIKMPVSTNNMTIYIDN